MKRFIAHVALLLIPALSFAQSNTIDASDWKTSTGVIGTLILTLIVAFIAVIIMSARITAFADSLRKKQFKKKKTEVSETIINLEEDNIDVILEQRKAALKYKLTGSELSGEESAQDERGLVSKLTHDPGYPFVHEKQDMKGEKFVISAPLRKITIWYLSAATFWLVFGTLVGEYLGLKFVWPEIDSISFFSFGRLRPVHTNTVFWGWGSLAMLGLAQYVIARTSNRELYSNKLAMAAFWLINISVLLGNLALMAGINNGGGEFREYIWPIMSLFGIALIITFYNFYQTIAKRKIREIYVSNWYIIASILWTIVIAALAYLPFNQNGLGETVIQGYYMHMGVGMWFMTFTLGLIYYYLPTSLNKPIYSYSLGVLAFWTQMLFYSLIGTHHFIFSPLPWWLQTVAIVFSIGMFIPVTAGTTNFLLTMNGSWNHITKSYVLPFFLVGVVFYFVGSGQGSFQALRYTNYVWHFTDFNVAHSHMTMYGIVCFILWACIYWIMPKITGVNPNQFWVGAHFWLAFVGLFIYSISMMVGGTLKGLSWIEENPFIQSVILMRGYWVWRAVGGTLMFVSHLIFAYNIWYMIKQEKPATKESFATA